MKYIALVFIAVVSMSCSVNGLIEQGNVNLHNRPTVHNIDGSISTVRSITVTVDDGSAYLISTVSDQGYIMSNQEAIDCFLVSGQHLGHFVNEDCANRYAVLLHEEQAEEYGE
jgi:hypothetical protein